MRSAWYQTSSSHFPILSIVEKSQEAICQAELIPEVMAPSIPPATRAFVFLKIPPSHPPEKSHFMESKMPPRPHSSLICASNSEISDFMVAIFVRIFTTAWIFHFFCTCFNLSSRRTRLFSASALCRVRFTFLSLVASSRIFSNIPTIKWGYYLCSKKEAKILYPSSCSRFSLISSMSFDHNSQNDMMRMMRFQSIVNNSILLLYLFL